MLTEKRYQVKFNSIKKYLLLIKQKQKNSRLPKSIWMKPCSKTRSNIFSELLLTIQFWHYLGMNATLSYWSYIDFYTLITYNCILTYTCNSDTVTGAEFISNRWSVIKNLANFTGKHLCWSLFFTKLQVFRPGTLLRRDSYTGFFLWNFKKFWRTRISKNI